MVVGGGEGFLGLSDGRERISIPRPVESKWETMLWEVIRGDCERLEIVSLSAIEGEYAAPVLATATRSLALSCFLHALC